MCLLLRSGLQAGNILEVAALDAAAVLGQLTVGAAVNGAVFQHCFGVAAAQNAGIRVADPKLTLDHAVPQIYFIAGICDGHIPVVLVAGQNVLCLCVFNAGDGQPVVGAVVAPAGAGLLFGQTVRADLDRNDGICCFLVRTGSCRLCCRSRRPSICKCRYREDGEHHTERQYHAHDAFFHDILSFVDRFARLSSQTEQPERTKDQVEYNTKVYGNKAFSPAASAKIWYKNMGKITIRGLNSLSQNLTVLPAPSGREPLAWRESFWLKGKAFCPGVPLPSAPVGRAASSPSQSKPVGFDSSPKGRALGSPRKLHLFAKASPFGRGGCERSEQTERARLLPAVPPLPQEASAANAACRRDFFRKKAVPKRPQAFRNCNNKV